MPRSEWQPDPLLQQQAHERELATSGQIPGTYPLQVLTVHHTADEGLPFPNGEAEERAYLQRLYEHHTRNREFFDVGYHLFIGGTGNVYEGRAAVAESDPDAPGAGLEPVGGFPGLDADGKVFNGAHVTGSNAGNYGIVFLCDCDQQPPTPEMPTAFVRTAATLLEDRGLDPLDMDVEYDNPAAPEHPTAHVPAICAHNDWPGTDTACPGRQLEAHLPMLREQVAGCLGDGGCFEEGWSYPGQSLATDPDLQATVERVAAETGTPAADTAPDTAPGQEQPSLWRRILRTLLPWFF